MITFQKSFLGTKTKKILNGISAYFNPSELIAIMGPSGELVCESPFSTQSHWYSHIGSGKTTFLDLLTGRRKSDSAFVSTEAM